MESLFPSDSRDLSGGENMPIFDQGDLFMHMVTGSCNIIYYRLRKHSLLFGSLESQLDFNKFELLICD